MTTYTINTNAIKSILLFGAKKDIRKYLQGIHVSIGTGTLRLTSSDGHTLATYTQGVQDSESYDLIIPRDTIELVLKASKKDWLELDPVHCTLEKIPFTPLDGTYPNARRVWEQERMIAGTPVLIDPEYYARLGKVAKQEKVGPSGIKLWHMNDSLFWEAGAIRGIIMGMRDCDVNKGDKPGF